MSSKLTKSDDKKKMVQCMLSHQDTINILLKTKVEPPYYAMQLLF